MFRINRLLTEPTIVCTLYVPLGECIYHALQDQRERKNIMCPVAAAKDCRIDLRTSKDTKSFLERGARVRGQNLTDFVLSSAQEKAELVLADQKEFVISPTQWDAFVAALDKPVTRRERLARLMSEPSVLERE
jgi:uncharacterized protein (DUF1778 family)